MKPGLRGKKLFFLCSVRLQTLAMAALVVPCLSVCPAFQSQSMKFTPPARMRECAAQ